MITANHEKILKAISKSKSSHRYSDVIQICDEYFSVSDYDCQFQVKHGVYRAQDDGFVHTTCSTLIDFFDSQTSISTPSNEKYVYAIKGNKRIKLTKMNDGSEYRQTMLTDLSEHKELASFELNNLNEIIEGIDSTIRYCATERNRHELDSICFDLENSLLVSTNTIVLRAFNVERRDCPKFNISKAQVKILRELLSLEESIKVILYQSFVSFSCNNWIS